MKPVVIPPGNKRMSRELVARLDLEIGEVTVRHFPDGESHVRIDTPVRGRRAIIVCSRITAALTRQAQREAHERR